MARPAKPSPRRRGRWRFEEMTDGVWAVAASLPERARLLISQHKSWSEADTAHTPPDLASRGHPPHFVERDAASVAPHLGYVHTLACKWGGPGRLTPLSPVRSLSRTHWRSGRR